MGRLPVIGKSLAGCALVVALAAGCGGGSAGHAAAGAEPGVVDVESVLGHLGAATIGTGIVVSDSGEVLTNNHVIRGATAIRISDPGNGKTYSATVVGYDPGLDMAVLKLAGASGASTVAFGKSSLAKVGEPVTAFGNAGGKGGIPSRSTGRIDALDQSITALDESGNAEQLTGLIETSASLTPGDSGGPLVNRAGRVIGMDTAGSADFPYRHGAKDGFAIPIDRALSVARQIEQGRASAAVHVGPTAFLGVGIESPGRGRPSGKFVGALVTGVGASTPADDAGIARGDIIFAVDGRTVASPAALQSSILSKTPGAPVRIGWIDPAGKTHLAEVHLTAGPPQ